MRTTESFIKAIGDNPLPPVEDWDPDYCGELELEIRADGTWFYDSSPVGRRKLQLLFSRVIKKEDQQYFLVTPVEKLGIQVEWMPFTIVDFDIIERDGIKILSLLDNCDNRVVLLENKQLDYSEYDGQKLPIICIRRNLFASFSRSCYYRLIETARIVDSDDSHQVVITSNGIDFILGECPPD